MKPVVLLILDGVGYRRSRIFNAVFKAKTPNIDSYKKKYPNNFIDASGPAVGVPKGYQGNSEVGHLTIGSGRVFLQALERINKHIDEGSFFTNDAFLKAARECKEKGTAMHLMGLVQDQGVHAHQNHLYALLKLCADQGLKKVYIHFFSDGRDSPVKSSNGFLKSLQAKMRKLKVGEIKTISGRYYAMDRDNRWERTELAFRAIDEGKGEHKKTASEAIKFAHGHGQTDEFIKPVIIGDYEGVKEGDSIIFFNYRFDRARQLTHAFVDDTFKHFERKKKKLTYVCMTEYYKDIPALVAFEPYRMKKLLGEILAEHGLTQLRISETEKYAHVTYFFNGEKEEPFPGEARNLIPSPKVATYDLQPEMSAYPITDALVKDIQNGKHDVIICNLANGDMVGHTGVFKAAVKAMEVVDECAGKIVEAALEKNGVVIMTADHGNCEEMIGKRQTTHTLNQVNCCFISNDQRFENCKIRKGGLCDIAPTMLEVLKIPKPPEMTGESLLVCPNQEKE